MRIHPPSGPRCLMIACSGVRIKSQELTALGVTLPGFVERGKVIASLPSLALLTLAAHTPPHWQVEYREIADLPEDRLDAGGYDLVAISSYTAQINMAYTLADRIRAQGVPVVLGGLHVSGLPDEAQGHATAIVVGEGEYAWQALCADFERGELRPRYNAAEYGAFDFRDARTPRYELLDMERYNRITVQTTRGCPRSCGFCAASLRISQFKLKPVAHVVRDIKAVHRLWPHPFIEFADDNTFVNHAWSKELMRGITPLNIRWFTETDIGVADDPELLELMSAAGCYQVLIGLESARRASMHAADPRQWKAGQWSRYADAIRRIQEHGISVNGCFILGWDDDDPRVFGETAAFIESLGLAEVQVTVLTPFPNAPLYGQMKRQGRLLEDPYWDKCTLFDVTYQPAKMTVRELETGLMSLFESLYNPEATARRRAIFKDCVRAKQALKNSSESANVA